MKAAIAYKVFHLFEGIYFWRPLNFWILYIRNISNIVTFKKFTECCFTLWFYNFIKTMDKRNKEDVTFWRKATKGKQNGATLMISADAKRIFPPVKLILEGELFE